MAPGKSAAQIYDILLKQMEKMVNEPNQIQNSVVAVADAEKHELGAVFHEWLVFKNAALSLDRTQLNFQLIATCEDGKAHVKLTRITYDYDLNREPIHYTAEEWITDKYAVNKKHTKLYPISAKFRSIIFMIGAVVGVYYYLSVDEIKGIYIILIAMCFKMAEASLRMFKK